MTAIVGIAGVVQARGEPPSRHVARIESACSKQEQWKSAASSLQILAGTPAAEYQQYLSAKLSSAQALTKTYQLESNPGFKELARFWRGRIFFDAGLWGLAADQFNQTVTAGPVSGQIPFQQAALECLEKIHERHPALGLSPESAARLPAFYRAAGEEPDFLSILNGATLEQALAQWGPAPSSTGRDIAGELLKTSGPSADYLQALRAIKSGHAADAATPLRQLLAVADLPVALSSRKDEIRIMLARSDFDAGNYAEAVEQLENVDRQSNELPYVLNDLAWSYLKLSDYSGAVGVALGLETAELKNLFAPEPMMVAAMAFNELCLYPEAENQVRHFHATYSPSFKWLKRYFDSGAAHRPALYPLALGFIRSKSVPVPEKIAMEWTRSPIFLSYLDAIHLDIAEQAILKSWIEAGSQPFQAQADAYLKGVALRRGSYRATIEKELIALSGRMLQQLQDVEDNLQLVEIEILNGAAKDFVWQHAHAGRPIRRVPVAMSTRTVASNDLLFWGKFDSEDGREPWPDEGFSPRAVLHNHCEEQEQRPKRSNR